MAWDEELFAVLDDLEQQAEAAFAVERAPEVADRARSEYAEVELAARLMASVGDDVTLHVAGVGAVRGVLDRVATGWCLLSGPAQDWVLPLAAVQAVDGASMRAVPSLAWPVTARLGIGSPLRRLAEAGERCLVHRTDGARHDGVLTRIGKDFVELAEGDPPRSTLIALAAVAAVQSLS